MSPLSSLRSTLRDWLGITDNERRIAVLEGKIDDIDTQVDDQIRDFLNFGQRDPEELDEMDALIGQIVDTLDLLLELAITDGQSARARELRRYLRMKQGHIRRHTRAA